MRLGAVKDILDRAGYKPVERVDQTISHAEMSNEELMKELKALTETTPELVN